MELRFSDFDHLKETIKEWGLDCVQLQKGRLLATLSIVNMHRVSINNTSLNRAFHQSGTAPAFGRTFGLFSDKPTDVDWLNQRLGQHAIAVFPDDGTFESFTVEGFDFLAITVETSFLERVAVLREEEDTLENLSTRGEIYFCQPDILAALRQVAFDALKTPHRLLGEPSDFEFDIVGLILKSLARPTARTLIPRLRKRDLAFDDAISLMKDSMGKLTIPQICQTIGVSERTLRYAFNEKISMSPKQYLSTLRLNRFRSDLLAADPHNTAISTVAAWHGFHHIGQLAIDYRNMFDELPSKTVKRTI